MTSQTVYTSKTGGCRSQATTPQIVSRENFVKILLSLSIYIEMVKSYNKMVKYLKSLNYTYDQHDQLRYIPVFVRWGYEQPRVLHKVHDEMILNYYSSYNHNSCSEQHVLFIKQFCSDTICQWPQHVNMLTCLIKYMLLNMLKEQWL